MNDNEKFKAIMDLSFRMLQNQPFLKRFEDAFLIIFKIETNFQEKRK